MQSPKAIADVTLRLERKIAAPPERVFAAWTTAEGLKHWFAPTNDHAVFVHALDLRIGGGYRIEMRHPGGASHIVTGAYREITPPRQLVFTWSWENREDAGETLVTVVVEPDGKGSRLVLLHEKFPNAEERDRHNEGWTGCLDRLLSALQ